MKIMIESVRIITKEGRKWKSKHSDGEITYHKTLKAAKEYRHTLYDVHPFALEYTELLDRGYE